MKISYLKPKLTTLRNFRTTYLATMLVVALATTFLAASHSQAQELQIGEILVPVGESSIQVHDHDTGMFERTLGPHPTLSAATGDVMTRPDRSPLLALFDANNVGKFTKMGLQNGNFGNNVIYDAQPNSFSIDLFSNVYVGQETATGDVLKFDQFENLIDRYDVPMVARGSAWIDVLDPVIWYVTGPGNIRRYNMMTRTAMADYGTGQINDPEEFKVIPDGPFKNQVLVADPPYVKRISADGTTTEGVYFAPGLQAYPIGLALDPDGIHFWISDKATSNVIEFNIDAGGTITEPASEVFSFSTTQFVEVSGLGIVGERTAGRTTPPPPSLTEGRMTGGGSVFTPTGVRVTHGFTLRCDITKRPNQLTVHWPDNMFKLTAVATVNCFDDPMITPSDKHAGFDTHSGTGMGELNGVPGAMISWTFTDAGEPGTADRCRIEISQLGIPVLVVDGFLENGNHQAHK
jgi:hypothetical protein